MAKKQKRKFLKLLSLSGRSLATILSLVAIAAGFYLQQSVDQQIKAQAMRRIQSAVLFPVSDSYRLGERITVSWELDPAFSSYADISLSILWSSANVRTPPFGFLAEGIQADQGNYQGEATFLLEDPEMVGENRYLLLELSDNPTTLPDFVDYVLGPFSVASAPLIGITVLVPNGGEEWTVGSEQTIQWSSSYLGGFSPLSSSDLITIELSRDGGANYNEVLFAETLNDNAESWTVSSPPTGNALIRITSLSGSKISDESDAPFSIISPPPQPFSGSYTSFPLLLDLLEGEQVQALSNFTAVGELSGANFFLKLISSSGGATDFFSIALGSSASPPGTWDLASTRQVQFRVELSWSGEGPAPAIESLSLRYLTQTVEAAGEGGEEEAASDQQTQAITLNLAIPLEEHPFESGRSLPLLLDLYLAPADNLGVTPLFSAKGKTITGSGEGAQSAVEIPAGILLLNESYAVFVKTNRHLSASSDFSAQSGSTAYQLSFPKLLAGDIAPGNKRDDQVNSLDFAVFTNEWNRTGSDLVSDFNNDHWVSTLDVAFILANFLKPGALLALNLGAWLL